MNQQQAQKRPKVILITRNLPPLVGGMERLNWHMADELSRYTQIKVVGPKGAAALKPEQTTLSEAPLKPLPLFILVAFCKALWLAWRWKPSVIMAGSGLTAPLAWLTSKLSGAKSAVYLHGLDITAPSRIYQKLWTPTFKKMDSVIVNSTPTRQLALTVGVPEKKVHLVHPGVNLPKAPQSAESLIAFKKRYGLEGKKILLSVGRLTTRKGLREFVEHSLPGIVRAAPNAMLLVVGETPKNSLRPGTQTASDIMAQARKSGVASHIKFLGRITEKQLVTAYEACDAHVFPVLHIPDDPEGFGMVAIEAAAHGLPTAAFATGGVIDAVSIGRSGYLAEKNNYAELNQYILQLLQHRPPNDIIQEFVKIFAWQNFGIKVYNALERLDTRADRDS
ncbi:glycosyltransferase family 4 protein [Marinobacter sp. NFXS9]|uniref:glycosyltransferase family 4 protein n=1 Tax=Marinobacter sp. NFXS9 TaxID=2818433 RepID=UPI0032DFBE1E